MSCSFTRTAFSLLAAIVFAFAAHAGELARPVPSTAQVTRFTRFNIRYTLRDIIAEGVQKVDFYISDDMGGTWRYYGEDHDRTSPMTVEVEGEGVYGFVCVVTDRFGNREREPGPRTRPETVIVVDRTPPTAKWLAPTQDILGRGQTVDFSWESADDHFGENPVKIQYAANAQGNHDRNANWQTAREGLPAVGDYKWTPPGSAKYNFRLLAEDRAGNVAVAYCAATVSVDNTPPYITAVRPLRSNKLENDIAVEARDNDGGSGVKEYSLYVSDNGAATWTLVKETVGGESLPVKRTAGSSIAWTAPRAGEYPLWPVVFDEAGNATPLPSIAVAGPYILVIDNEPPQVTLSNSFLMGRSAVLANETRRIEWTSYDPHIREGSAKILLSLDNGNNWRELRSGLAANGFETINFPFSEQSEEAKLKVTVEDEFGNVGESVSETFKLSAAETTIDRVTPRGGGASSSTSGDVFGLGSSGGDAAPTPPSTAGGWFGLGGGDSPTAPSTAPSIPSLPGFNTPGGSGFDSFGVPGGDSYGGGSDMYRPLGGGSHGGESSAGSVPQAMLRDSGGGFGSGGGLFGGASGSMPPPPGGGSMPPPPPGGGGFGGGGGGYQDFGISPPASEDTSWQPSPGAGLAGGGFGGGWEASPSASGGIAGGASSGWGEAPASSGSDGGFDLGQFMGSPGGGSAPVAEATELPFDSGWAGAGSGSAPVDNAWAEGLGASGAAAPSFDGFDGFDGFGGDAAGVTPPAVRQGDQGGFTDFGSADAGGLSLDGFGGGDVMEGVELPGASFGSGGSAQPRQVASAPPSPPFGGSLRPPSSSAPSAPQPPSEQPSATGERTQPWPGISDSMPPVAQRDTPPGMPTLDGGGASASPGSGLSLPQPLEARPDRPVNTRQASMHHVRESKAFRDEGRPDLALESARRALEVDPTNPAAFMELSQVNARMEPPDHVAAANLAKEATNLQADWETWWNCADVFYVWANASNREVQALQRKGQTPPMNLVDERNSTLSNANIAINNAASVLPPGDRAAARKVAVTQGMIAYQRAVSVPEPFNPGATDDRFALDEYRRRQAEYKAVVAPLLQEAMPYFKNALSMGGAPEYSETFQLGIINFRLAGLERDTGDAAQATTHYQEAVNYLEQATTAANAPKEGPREAYYMMALCHDQLASQPSANRARHRELALRYWRQTADFYEDPESPYRVYAEQRIDTLSEEMGL